MIKKLQYIFHQTGSSVGKVIVAIHGWEGDRISMQPIMNMMKIHNAGWYLLEAPYTIKKSNGRSWCNQISEGVWEIDETKRLLNTFFSGIFEKYPSKNIYVLGFSQGAMVCLDIVLYLDQPLGGIFPICGFLRQPELEIKRYHSCQKNTPVLLGHGKDDDRVPAKASETAYSLLKKQGANVKLFLYNGKHKIGMDYIKKMCEMIQA